MAKKRTLSYPPKGKKKLAGKAPKAKAKSPAKPRTPRAQALPGMEQVRNATLDSYCEGIGENRDQANQLRGEEASMKDAALREMKRTGVVVYKHAGIELVRVPGGDDTLRVRKSKGGDAELGTPSDADTSAGDGDEPAGD